MSVAERLAAVTSQASGPAGLSDPAAAKAALRRALEAAHTELGKDHASVLEGTRVLAGLHRRDGELSAARTLLEEAMAAGYFTRGVDHPAMLGLAYDLGVLADELENRHEARINFDRVRRLGPGVLGPDHEYVRAADHYLSRMTPSVPAPRSAPDDAPPPGARPPTPSDRPLWPETPAAAAPAPAASWFEPVPRPTPDPASGLPATSEPPGTPAPVSTVAGPAPRPKAASRHAVAIGGPARPPADARPAGSRFVLIVLLLAAAIVMAAGATALVLQFLRAERDQPPAPRRAPGSPSASPIQLGLQDSGGSVTLNWTDPSSGGVPFVIAYGLADGPADRSQRLTAGTTTITINGLNPQVNYCFTVAGIESATAIALSHAICTRRSLAGQPSGPGDLSAPARPSATR